MRPKEYLNQLRILNTKIENKLREVSDLKLMATCTGSMGGDDVRVVSSPSGDGLVNKVVKYVELEEEINREIDRFTDLKHQIINQIHNIDNDLYIKILFKRYVEYKNLAFISLEMNYSYERVRHLHGEALTEFAKVNNLTQVSTQ